ncbi:hypothetical protein [Pandoraea commovens]|uniref:hypothetical protein n=1 Tax=Pandoraea commovens TaxID=2508289 RepID=UPI001240B32F|nr:hypothetical protein [Pandoraea commovens]
MLLGLNVFNLIEILLLRIKLILVGIDFKKITIIDYLGLICMFGLPLVISMMIAFATPSDILENYWARRWVDVVLQFFPKLLDVPEESKDPQFVVFYHATMLALDVVLSLPMVFIALIKLAKERREGRGGRSVWQTLKLCACGVLMVAVEVGIFSMGYSDGRGAVFWHSRASLAFGAIIFHFGSLLFLSGTVIVFLELMILFGFVRLIRKVFQGWL